MGIKANVHELLFFVHNQVEYECENETCQITLKILPVETPMAAGGWEVAPDAKYILVGCLNHEHATIKP